MRGIRFFLLGLTFMFSLTALVNPAHAQNDVGEDAYVDYEGEVEQATFIEYGSNLSEIDAYSETYNWDYYEDVDYISADFTIYQDGNPAYYNFGYDDYFQVELDGYVSTHQGSTYDAVGQSWTCYFDEYGEGDDDCDLEENYYTLAEVSTAPPQVSSISPNSVNQGSSGNLTISGHNLVDPFGYATINVYGGSGLNLQLTSGDSNGLQAAYSTSSSTTVGDYNLSISTSFGESDYSKFTVGYPRAVITNVQPSIWPAGTSFTATITGTGFGSTPSVTVVAPGVAPGQASVISPGTQVQIPIVVDPGAPTGPVAISIQPGYGGSPFACGNCNGQSPVGSATATVEAQQFLPRINQVTQSSSLSACQNGMDVSTTNTQSTNVLVGQQMLLCVPPPPSGVTIQSQSWTFSVPNDEVGGFSSSNGSGNPSNQSGGSKTAISSLSQSNLTFYFITPGSSDSVTYQWILSNGTVGSNTANFAVSGPTGSHRPSAQMGAPIIRNSKIGPLGMAITTGTGATGSVGIIFTTSDQPPTNSMPGSKAQFQWIQIINSTLQTILSPAMLSSKANGPGLDGTYPYFSDTATRTYDSPSLGLPSIFGMVAESFDATMYLMWDPALPSGCSPASTSTQPGTLYQQTASTCTSIPIPLGSVEWKFNDCGINTLQNQANGTSWSLSCETYVVNSAQTPVDFPQWTQTVHPLP